MDKEILLQFATWQEFQKNISPTVIKWREMLMDVFMRFIGDKPIKNITIDDIYLWRRDMEKRGLAPSTIKGYMLTVKMFFKFCYEKGLSKMDFFQIKSPKIYPQRVVVLSREEVETFVEGLSVKYRAIAECLLSTGARISELLALDRDDIIDGEIRIISAKNKIERTLVMTDRAQHWLNKYLKTRKDDNPALFMSNTGDRLACGTVENIFRMYRESRGIEKKITPHVFRHTAGSWLYNGTRDIVAAQNYLGHKSIDTTVRFYVNVDEEKLKPLVRSNLSF